MGLNWGSDGAMLVCAWQRDDARQEKVSCGYRGFVSVIQPYRTCPFGHRSCLGKLGREIWLEVPLFPHSFLYGAD